MSPAACTTTTRRLVRYDGHFLLTGITTVRQRTTTTAPILTAGKTTLGHLLTTGHKVMSVHTLHTKRARLAFLILGSDRVRSFALMLA